MKILLVNNQFVIGGAARVATIMCNAFFERGYDIRIVTDCRSIYKGYGVNKSIKVYPTITKDYSNRIFGKVSKFIHIVKRIRSAIKSSEPDIIITIQADMFLRTLLANACLHYPIIAADHSTITHRYDAITDFTRNHLYRYAKGLSILTEKDKKILGDKYPNKEVIYNPLSFPILNGQTVRRNNVLCAGRLDVWRIKGFDIIINIWAKLAKHYPNWILEIAGDGSEQSIAYLQGLINDLGIQSSVRLLGHVEDMMSLYKETSIFVLPSRIEGFPMVLMEAMSQGCASVAFRIQGSTDEMVVSQSGYVIDDGDIQGFSDALQELLDSPKTREEMSIKARESVKRFSVDSFIDHWISYIERLLNL